MSPEIADDVARPWYRMDDLRRTGVLVDVRLPRGSAVVAQVRRWPAAASPLWWVDDRGEQIGRYLTEAVRLAAGVEPHWHPVAWRPLAGVVWPDALGEPLVMQRYVPPPPPREAHIAEPPEPTNGWPYPGLPLRQMMPPATLAECEARVLRGLRTMDTPGVVAGDNLAGRGVSNMLVVLTNTLYDVTGAQTARHREQGDAYVDRAHLGDAVQAFVPDRRDLTDWEYALGWLTALTPREVKIVRMRGANPSHSWSQIAERVGYAGPSGALMAYRRALTALFKQAAKG